MIMEQLVKLVIQIAKHAQKLLINAFLAMKIDFFFKINVIMFVQVEQNN